MATEKDFLEDVNKVGCVVVVVLWSFWWFLLGGSCFLNFMLFLNFVFVDVVFVFSCFVVVL